MEGSKRDGGFRSSLLVRQRLWGISKTKSNYCCLCRRSVWDHRGQFVCFVLPSAHAINTACTLAHFPHSHATNHLTQRY